MDHTHAVACPDTPWIVNNVTGAAAEWPITAYCGMTTFFGGTPILDTSVGYGIVLGFGIFFSIVTTILVWLDSRFVGTRYDSSEQFNTAGRSVQTGLTASVIVSQWTWAATLLQSSNVAYQYGVSGPFWYASGATIQILLFGVLAIELKRKAPNAHTMCEIILARWGPTAHKVFLFFALITNIIVTSMLLLGGAAVINALTGMNLSLASFLIPIGTIVYTMSGGLKATFLASYIHTAVIMVILLLFVFVVYTSSPDLGSAQVVYERLQSYSSVFPVEKNSGGSYATMMSGGGLMFGVINVVGNFGTVFCDQSYWQSAIAAKPSAAIKGYLLGGFVWFAIPFALATALGLSAIALDLPISPDEANAGLVPPAVAVHFWGVPGAVTITVMLFMAVTSTGSAELIAVSSLIAYDVYKVYVKPDCTGPELLKVSRITTVVFGVFMGLLAVLLNVMGLSLGYVYLAMGVLIGSAVFPVSFVLLWSKCTAKAAMSGAIIGQILAVSAWFIAAQAYGGEVTLASTGQDEPLLIGNLVAILSSGLITTLLTLHDPDDYDYQSSRDIKVLEDDSAPITETEEELEYASAMTKKFGVGFTLVIAVGWPLCSLPAGVFSQGYFGFWVMVSMIWAFVGTVVIIALPLYESSDALLGVISGCLLCKCKDPGLLEDAEMNITGKSQYQSDANLP